MLDKKYAKKVMENQSQIDKARRDLQAFSSQILGSSKRAIFALHRDAPQDARKELDEAKQGIKRGNELTKKQGRLTFEGAWRAAQEEYAEACVFEQYVRTGSVGPVEGVSADPDIFIGAISDLLGEMVRLSITRVVAGDRSFVATAFYDAREIVSFLLQMDLTGGLRSKVDQAKQHLRKIEEMNYDVQLRAGDSRRSVA